MVTRLLCLAVLLLLPRFVLAEEPWTPPGTCKVRNWNDVEIWREWNGHTPPANTANWDEEASRIANNRDVWRWLDRLYVALAGGEVLTLSDCAFGDDLHFYLYERYEEAGGFHVVRVSFYEDHLYALVMRRTGKVFAISSLPMWSPDRSRFAYSVCDLLNGKEEIAVMSMAGDGPKLEAKASLPCTLGDCRLAWESNTMVGATCEDLQGNGSNRQVVRLTRRGDGWATTTSPR
jgi:hypothetical protein